MYGAGIIAEGGESVDEVEVAYGIINAQLRYRFDNYTVAIYGQNLSDQRYSQFINPEIFAASPGAPRRVGIQLSFVY